MSLLDKLKELNFIKADVKIPNLKSIKILSGNTNKQVVTVNKNNITININNASEQEKQRLQEVIAELARKKKINKTYGIDYINLHGIGESNITKIEHAITQFKGEFSRKPDIESGRGHVVVTVYF
jgi:hypothetical protein